MDENGRGFAAFECDLENGRRIPAICEKLGWLTPKHIGSCISRKARSATLGPGNLTLVPSETRKVVVNQSFSQDFELVTEHERVHCFRWVPGEQYPRLRFIVRFAETNPDVMANLEAYRRRANSPGSLKIEYKPLRDRAMISPRDR